MTTQRTMSNHSMTDELDSCVECSLPADYIHPKVLCVEHWDEWWTEGYTDDERPDHYLEQLKSAQQSLSIEDSAAKIRALDYYRQQMYR